MSFADLYRYRMGALGATRPVRNLLLKQREFDLYYENTLDRAPCVIDGKPEQAVFQDHSQSNNKDLSDDKYMVVPNDVLIDVGSYVKWRDEDWLVFTKEVKTIATHQQLKIKHVNQRLKWLVDQDSKIVCNDGNGWGAYIQNQTLYTLGVSFAGQYLPLANGKMSVFIKNTSETKNVKVGTRLFIAGQVYKVEFVDSVSRLGLINWLLDEDTKNSEVDNFDLGIANYWDSGKKGDVHETKEAHAPNAPETSIHGSKLKDGWDIEGEKKARLGHSYEYTVKGSGETNPVVSEWIVGDIETLPFVVTSKTSTSISIQVKDDYRLVGQLATIAAKVDGEIKNIAIKIIKKFS